jgi:hypothetical protein
MAIQDLTAKELLAIPKDRPDKLFDNDADTAKKQFRELAMLWHEDINRAPEAPAVFRHIKDLYDEAEKRIGTPAWSCSNKYEFHIKNGRTVRRAFRVKRQFELGTTYIGDAAVTYVLNGNHGQLFRNAIMHITNFKYPDAATAQQFAAALPSLETSFEADEGFVIVIRKTKNVLLLRDVLNHFGTLPDTQTAWIFSRLATLCCYLQSTAKLTHNDITPDSVFIDSVKHSIHLLGGWWYAAPIGARKLLRVSPYASLYGYPSASRTPVPDFRNDLTLIRAVARELLGDVNGIKYRTANSTYPRPFVEWLSAATSGKAISDYQSWQKCRDESFGKRQYLVMPIDADTLYPGTDQ